MNKQIVWKCVICKRILAMVVNDEKVITGLRSWRFSYNELFGRMCVDCLASKENVYPWRKR